MKPFNEYQEYCTLSVDVDATIYSDGGAMRMFADYGAIYATKVCSVMAGDGRNSVGYIVTVFDGLRFTREIERDRHGVTVNRIMGMSKPQDYFGRPGTDRKTMLADAKRKVGAWQEQYA